MVMLSNDIISSQPRGQMTLEAMGLLADCVGAAYPGILGRGRPVISSSAISSPPVRRYRGPMCCSPLQSIVFDSPRSSVNMLGLVDFFTLTFCKLFPGPVVVVLTNCCWSFFFFFFPFHSPCSGQWLGDWLASWPLCWQHVHGVYAHLTILLQAMRFLRSVAPSCFWSGSHLNIQNLPLMSVWFWMLVNQARLIPASVFLLGLLARMFQSQPYFKIYFLQNFYHTDL